MSKRPISTSDLSLDEQKNVIAALTFLREKIGSWTATAKLLRFETLSLANMVHGRRSVSANLTFRLAKLVEVPVDQLLAGKWPKPGTCPKCGYCPRRVG